jgi:hypothetical protein
MYNYSILNFVLTLTSPTGYSKTQTAHTTAGRGGGVLGRDVFVAVFLLKKYFLRSEVPAIKGLFLTALG